jgi:hypothetical protein
MYLGIRKESRDTITTFTAELIEKSHLRLLRNIYYSFIGLLRKGTMALSKRMKHIKKLAQRSIKSRSRVGGSLHTEQQAENSVRSEDQIEIGSTSENRTVSSVCNSEARAGQSKLDQLDVEDNVSI